MHQKKDRPTEKIFSGTVIAFHVHMKRILSLAALAFAVASSAYADAPPVARAASRPAIITERPEGKFFRLPPRLATRSTFARAARFPAMVKPKAKPDIQASAPPATKDANKLLLYVYDDLR